MKNEGLINETELRKAIHQLYGNGELFEVRVISSGKKNKPLSGYFKDADTLLKAFESVDLRNCNVYITINQVNDSLFSRVQSEHFVSGANSTSDTEIDGYKWLFIDLDPVRPTGISSTDTELHYAFTLAKKVSEYLKNIGFEDPVKAVSGNGAHLLYRINLMRNEENSNLIERCLKALSLMFDTDEVGVDTSNFNPSRVCKLYGTMAQKGTNTEDRPFRMSYIIGDAKEARITDKEFLKKLAAELPDENIQPKPTKYNNYNPSEFDIEDWMSKYGLRYTTKAFKGGTKYILDECPFDSSHKAPDSMITKSASGAIGFKCLHNHCQDYHWRDLRLKYEPDAYEFNDNDKRIEDGWAKHNRDKEQKEITTTEDDIPVFQTAEMILNRIEPEPEYIRTGINKIDKALCGLEKGKLSVISGMRAAAKSTLLSEIMLNAIENGNTVVCYSGELSDKSFMDWMYLQAAGKGNVKVSAKYQNFYYVEDAIRTKIARWLGENFWLYNNVKSNNPDFLLKNIISKCNATKADMVIIDNLMALDVKEYNRSNEYDAQTRFMWALKKVAQDCNVHVILVAHPRKAQGFLRLDDISGTGNIANIIDNAFIIHRNNLDFRDKAKDIMKASGNLWMIEEGTNVTNVLEIAKDREHGTCDIFVDLYYEAESKRLKNYRAENIVYGWNDDFETPDGQEVIPFD